MVPQSCVLKVVILKVGVLQCSLGETKPPDPTVVLLGALYVGAHGYRGKEEVLEWELELELELARPEG